MMMIMMKKYDTGLNIDNNNNDNDEENYDTNEGCRSR